MLKPLESTFQVYVNDQYLNWDPNNRVKVRIISSGTYHGMFFHAQRQNFL